ncbi:SusC/RagA family TonB-linked outer membrane protein [Maribellus maritimus]|uniref:SusC/RagA family TonB-linked outer membrane protein n=1 Tax=Maribellus maritimus TaxID=2870838 RepID=UPI001EEA0627|nr:SusC/RagA family TonB-linked outer membrane protein [Maribellus maritimus]MCG6190833.1 SusC/RagA family TonB-linked outer membrane protein [Maribellus maritimus]
MKKKLNLIISRGLPPEMKKKLLFMKLTLMIICAAVLQTMAAVSYSQATFLSVNLKDAKVETVMEQIEGQTDFYFLYSRSVIDVDRRVDIKMKNEKITKVLDVLFEGSDVRYQINDKQIVLSKEVKKSLSGNQQQKAISGKVTDSSGSPLPGVTVIVKGTTNGTVTNTDGDYSLSNIPTDAILQFSFVGMQSQEITIGSRTNINITLQEEAISLDEVVAIGYGSQSRRTLTTSIAKVNSETLENIPITSVGDGLKGKISGARIYSNNFAPGEEPIIRIRGGSSINKSNDPLILVDGMEIGLSDINSNDIESIEVLKDAASTAIYGSRASNGVVLVTTKRGGVNKAPRISFEASWTSQYFERMYDFMNAEDFISYVRPRVANSINPGYNYTSGYAASSANDENSIYTTRYLQEGEAVPEGWKSMTDPLDPTKTLVFQNNDIVNAMFDPALLQNYYINIDGGTQNLAYSGSIGYTDDAGIAVGSGWKRFSARSNVDAKINDKIKLSTNLSFTNSNTDEIYNQQYVIARGLTTAPTHRLYWKDGTPAPGYNWASPTPMYNAYTRNETQKDQRLSMTGLLDWNIFKDLSVKFSGSYYQGMWQRDFFMKANYFDNSRTAISEFSLDNKTKFETYFTYGKNFDNHSLSLVGGNSFFSIKSKDVYAEAMGSSSDAIETLNVAPTKNDASSYIEEEALIGYFGRLTYDYKKKYLLSANFRYDGSSRFLNENKWGFFPGASVGWMISEEQFFSSLKSRINNLKLRASYGSTGNNSIGLYSAMGNATASLIYDGNAGMYSSSMANSSLGWEKTNQLDLGLDLNLNDRIFFIADYFDKRTQNLIFDKTLPDITGYSSIETNIGEVKFYGFDLELKTINIKKHDFEWTSGITYSYVKNKVIKLPDNGRYKNRIGGTVVDSNDPTLDYGGIAEGEPLYRYYGYVVDHIIQTKEEANNALYDQSAKGYSPDDETSIKGRKFLGDYEWVDRNDDGEIDSRDQFELGVTVPHSTGGITNNFKYRNLSLKIYLDFALGHSINDVMFSRHFLNTFSYSSALVEQAKDTWTTDNTDASYARLVASDSGDGNQNFARKSSAFNFKGDYLCVREIVLNYDFPDHVLENMGIKGIQNVNLYLTGNNLYYFTSVIGVSPESGTSTTYASNYYNYPAIRKFGFGLKVTF